MSRLAPIAYGAVLAVEAAALAFRYATDPPAPSDPLSIHLGWAGVASMVAMLVYSVARRSKRLRNLLRLSAWLHLHIFLGLQGALFVLFHSLHLWQRLATVVWTNPAVLSLLSVLVVLCSGLFGRYLYGWLPRTLGGEQMAARDVDAELSTLSPDLPSEVAALWQDVPRGGGFLALARAHARTRGALARLDAFDLPPDVRALAARRVALERRKAVLSSAQRWFGAWIVLHRPLAAILFVLAAVHVVLSYMFTPSLGR